MSEPTKDPSTDLENVGVLPFREHSSSVDSAEVRGELQYYTDTKRVPRNNRQSLNSIIVVPKSGIPEQDKGQELNKDKAIEMIRQLTASSTHERDIVHGTEKHKEKVASRIPAKIQEVIDLLSKFDEKGAREITESFDGDLPIGTAVDILSASSESGIASSTGAGDSQGPDAPASSDEKYCVSSNVAASAYLDAHHSVPLPIPPSTAAAAAGGGGGSSAAGDASKQPKKGASKGSLKTKSGKKRGAGGSRGGSRGGSSRASPTVDVQEMTLAEKLSELILNMDGNGASRNSPVNRIHLNGMVDEWANDDDTGYIVIPITEQEYAEVERETTRRLVAQRELSQDEIDMADEFDGESYVDEYDLKEIRRQSLRAAGKQYFSGEGSDDDDDEEEEEEEEESNEEDGEGSLSDDDSRSGLGAEDEGKGENNQSRIKERGGEAGDLEDEGTQVREETYSKPKRLGKGRKNGKKRGNKNKELSRTQYDSMIMDVSMVENVAEYQFSSSFDVGSSNHSLYCPSVVTSTGAEHGSVFADSELGVGEGETLSEVGSAIGERLEGMSGTIFGHGHLSSQSIGDSLLSSGASSVSGRRGEGEGGGGADSAAAGAGATASPGWGAGGADFANNRLSARSLASQQSGQPSISMISLTTSRSHAEESLCTAAQMELSMKTAYSLQTEITSASASIASILETEGEMEELGHRAAPGCAEREVATVLPPLGSNPASTSTSAPAAVLGTVSDGALPAAVASSITVTEESSKPLSALSPIKAGSGFAGAAGPSELSPTGSTQSSTLLPFQSTKTALSALSSETGAGKERMGRDEQDADVDGDARSALTEGGFGFVGGFGGARGSIGSVDSGVSERSYATAAAGGGAPSISKSSEFGSTPPPPPAALEMEGRRDAEELTNMGTESSLYMDPLGVGAMGLGPAVGEKSRSGRPSRDKPGRRQSLSDMRRSEIIGQNKFVGPDGITQCYFNLKVIFEPYRTGFEDTKDFQHERGTIIAGRYEVSDVLGQAAFSTALQCADLVAEEHEPQWVCLKVIKNNKDFFDQSMDEIKLLQYINSCGDPDEHHVLRLIDFFYYKEHLFIVSELLKENLYEFSRFVKDSGNEPYYTIPRLKRIMKQVLEALEFVHSLKLIHCDIKPENIVIKSFSRCEVKLIDFGSSCFITDNLTSYIQSRSYRAPEVIIDHHYDSRIDIWSMGAVLAELHTGYVLFQNDSVPTMLSRITGIMGTFPPHVLRAGKDTHKYFTPSNVVYDRDEESPGYLLIFPKKTSLRARVHLPPPGEMSQDQKLFLDFLYQMMNLDPAERVTAAEALQHPWLADADSIYVSEYIIQPPKMMPAPPPSSGDFDYEDDDDEGGEDGEERFYPPPVPEDDIIGYFDEEEEIDEDDDDAEEEEEDRDFEDGKADAENKHPDFSVGKAVLLGAVKSGSARVGSGGSSRERDEGQQGKEEDEDAADFAEIERRFREGNYGEVTFDPASKADGDSETPAEDGERGDGSTEKRQLGSAAVCQGEDKGKGGRDDSREGKEEEDEIGLKEVPSISDSWSPDRAKLADKDAAADPDHPASA